MQSILSLSLDVLLNDSLVMHLRGNLLKIYIGLYRWYQNHPENEHPTIKQLSQQIHLSPSTVAKGLKELESLGLLTIQRRQKGNRNHYWLEGVKREESLERFSEPLKKDSTAKVEQNNDPGVNESLSDEKLASWSRAAPLKTIDKKDNSDNTQLKKELWRIG